MGFKTAVNLLMLYLHFVNLFDILHSQAVRCVAW